LNNFLPLDRNLLKHWLWEDKPFSKGQAWVDLLMLANYKDKKKPVNGEMQIYKRGDVNLSMKQLSDRWGWDRRTVKRFLDLLSNDKMVSVNSTTHGTTITIVNYEVFNSSCTTECTTNAHLNVQPNVQPMAQPNVQQMPTTNKDKELEEIKEGEKCKEDNIPPLSPKGETEEKKDKPKRKQFVIPTVEEVEEYCFERNNKVDAEMFVNFYASKGWMIGKNPMKDWKAAVRTWERKDKESGKPSQKRSSGGIDWDNV